MGFWFFRYDDSIVIIRNGVCNMKFLDRLLSLIVALSMIIVLALIAMIFNDLNDIWSAMLDLQILVMSELNIGTEI
tara:strand:- start:529 stop:756 length:228 start_codon:yes stop_codon:yes gene_type:complete